MFKKTLLGWMVLSFLFLSVGSQVGWTQERQNETLKTIHSRKSVRQYLDKPVSRADLETIVKAAMAAPTAIDKRPWAFVIVTDKAQLSALAEGLPYGRMIAKAGGAIVLCGIPHESFGEFWIQDCSAAAENALLATESLGLGAVWIGVYNVPENIAHVREVLNLPEEVVPLNVMPIGYPTGAEKPKNKYDPDKIHWEQWSPSPESQELKG